jgi:hypothetical protein
MPKTRKEGAGMMEREVVEYAPGEAGASEAIFAALRGLPKAHHNDMPGEAMRRHNAARCHEILAAAGIEDTGACVMDKGALHSLGLGSRLIDRQSQNMTVAARATAERKTLGHLS